MKNQLKTYFIFLSILLCLNTIYFYIYFSFLELNFSWLHLFFLVIGNISYSILLLLFKLKIWRIITYVLITAFFLWSLMNYAYFSVFNTFLDFSWGQMSQVNVNFLGFMKDFVYLVPIRLYIISIVVLIGIFVNSIIYFKFLDRKNEKILYGSEKLNLLDWKNKKSKRFFKVIVLIVIFVFVNLGALGTAAYLSDFPRLAWWQVEKQIADLGVWGHFYSQLYSKVGDENEVAQKNGDDSKDIVVEDLRTDLEKTKEVLAKMEKLANKKSQKYSLPVLEKKPNVLVVQLESLPLWILENDPTPMPYLKSLMDNNITVEKFHPNSCQTINAEFSSLCSFWPNSEEPISYSHKENQYSCLPSILNEEYEYETFLFHSDYKEFWDRDILSPKWGFDNLYFVPYYKLKQDDISVFSNAVDVLAEREDPFFAYLISFTTHGPHNDSMYAYNKGMNGLELGSYEGVLDEKIGSIEITEEETRDYLGFTLATDRALEIMMEKMKDNGMLEDTIILLYNDHKYYGFGGDDLEAWELTHESPFVMILPDKVRAEIQQVASHVDVAPTILNLIEQDDYEAREHFVGQSLFEPDFANQAFNKCLGEVYYINEDINVRGNAKAELYQVFDKNKKMTEIEGQAWLNLVQELVETSDKTIYADGLLGKE